MIRSLKGFNSFDYNVNGISNKEYMDGCYTFINTDLLLNLTCNRCNIGFMNWFDQALPKIFKEPRILFDQHPLEKSTIKYQVLSDFLAKVLIHSNNRSHGKFNHDEFHRLIQQSEEIKELLKKDYEFIVNNEFKIKLLPQCLVYILYYATNIILYSMEFSPYIYKEKISPLKNYIHLSSPPTKTTSSSSQEEMNPTAQDNDDDDDTTNKIDSDFNAYYKSYKEKFKHHSILENINYPGYNYQLYDEMNPPSTQEKVEFLNITSPLPNIDYEKCYHLCYENAEKSKKLLDHLDINLFNKDEKTTKRYYFPCSLNFSFYFLKFVYEFNNINYYLYHE